MSNRVDFYGGRYELSQNVPSDFDSLGSRFQFTLLKRSGWQPHSALDGLSRNWPAVYVLVGSDSVYVGETLNSVSRMRSHALDPHKTSVKNAFILFEEKFNKSACLDLESFLIKRFSGDGKFKVINRNGGVLDSDYYNRAAYREDFADIFEYLRRHGLFEGSLDEIENSDLFRLSPFKDLNEGQKYTVAKIVEHLLEDEKSSRSSRAVIEGAAGTGKTVVLIYLLKYLRDLDLNLSLGQLAEEEPAMEVQSELMNSEFVAAVQSFSVCFVVPQQALRETVKKICRSTGGLEEIKVYSPFELGKSTEIFDLVLVDEGHRLNRGGNQANGGLNTQYVEINEDLFNVRDKSRSQLDWVYKKSRHSIVVFDRNQSVRPSDLKKEAVEQEIQDAKSRGRHHELEIQMRMRSSSEYLKDFSAILRGEEVSAGMKQRYPDYDIRVFDDFAEMRKEILELNARFGLSRIVSGYSRKWKSKKFPEDFDFKFGDLKLRWNTKIVDWVSSPGSVEEIGSIHTVQGYDLNYCGVIIGKDIQLSPETGKSFYSRDDYFDTKGRERVNGENLTPEEMLEFIIQIYLVLVSRGILGTFLYIEDPLLREHFRRQLEK